MRNDNSIKEEVRNMMKKIIVTGCNGQLGRAINKIYKDSTEYVCEYRCQRA